MFKLDSHQNTKITGDIMENQEVLKAIAVLADKVGRYHERLMFMERELEKHQKDETSHCEGDCDCKKN